MVLSNAVEYEPRGSCWGNTPMAVISENGKHRMLSQLIIGRRKKAPRGFFTRAALDDALL